MNYENLIIETSQDFVTEITLNRPNQMNTFNTPLAQELNSALEEMESDDLTRVIIVKGAGRAFCAGIDISEFSDRTANEYREWIERMERPLVTISHISKPVIAQVHGVAAANGAGLVAAADLAIASKSARFGLTAINVGLNCVGPVVPVARSVGRKRALELLLFGDLIKAPEALEMGLINKVTASENLERETRSWAVRLAQKSPLALQIAKKAFYTATDMDYERAFQYMNEAFARLCTTQDAHEGVDAFLAKRDPVWKQC
ncbi:enoyl-CoA hydratase-related protein [Desulfococcaceae bacterium HSG9]|nr:enoyl-CoA hydratase-related protein [Desulfococcaceae bacterium HSG9]